MVQGLKFLSKKGFNPQNQTNRKQVWEAQQSSKLEEERLRRRQDELRREREDEEFCRIQHGDGSQAQLRFMYNAPPGLEKAKDGDGNTSEPVKDAPKDVTQVQEGDDAAAAAFRRMLASSAAVQQTSQMNEEEGDESQQQSAHRFEPVLQGSTMDPLGDKNQKNQDADTRSALEKAVGRRDRGSALTLEEQLARFPQLKNAPMAKGMSTTDVNVSFKPLGAQLRNVRCLACGVWGHSRGDRECSKTGWNPFDIRRPAAPLVADSTSIRPNREEKRNTGGGDNDNESTNSRSSSSDETRRHRKRRHKSKKRKRRHKESRKRHRRRRSRSESPRESERGRKRRSRSQSSWEEHESRRGRRSPKRDGT
eukprot:scaffold22583_cov106-Cylindrotheca_fusiformis.AAC.38